MRSPEDKITHSRADAARRQKIRGLFSEVPAARLDAIDTLKDAWEVEEPSFNQAELANFDPQAAILAAARRDAIKEVVTWITKL